MGTLLLKVRKGRASSASFAAFNGCTIGSESTNTVVVLDDEEVAARHAAITEQDGSLQITDLGAEPGIHLENGSSITRLGEGESASLRPGTRIRIGRTELEVVEADASDTTGTSQSLTHTIDLDKSNPLYKTLVATARWIDKALPRLVVTTEGVRQIAEMRGLRLRIGRVQRKGAAGFKGVGHTLPINLCVLPHDAKDLDIAQITVSVEGGPKGPRNELVLERLHEGDPEIRVEPILGDEAPSVVLDGPGKTCTLGPDVRLDLGRFEAFVFVRCDARGRPCDPGLHDAALQSLVRRGALPRHLLEEAEREAKSRGFHAVEILLRDGHVAAAMWVAALRAQAVPDSPVPEASRTAPTEREARLEDIVAEFLLLREEGKNPSVEEYLERYPAYAEDLAFLLGESSDGLPPETDQEDRTRKADAGMRTPAPTQLGPYELLERVAAGGGGTVYRARHVESLHVVALKVLDSIVVGDPRDFERFRREARMLRGMDLVNVVPVLDAGEDQGRHYIAMKWIEGATLKDLAEGLGAGGDKDEMLERLAPMEERARLVARIARTFEAVHGYGILHRDIKPTNVLVDRLGEPMIIDFGIARDPGLGELTMTLDGPMGTPRYLSPELLSGGNVEVTRQTDIYGLGLCLYELAAGVRAFEQETRKDLFTQIRSTGPAPAHTVNRKVPFSLSAIIMRATEINPARRYPSMAAMAADLERFARGAPPEGATLRRASPIRRFLIHRRKAVAAAAVLLLALGALGAHLWERAAKERAIRELESHVTPWFLAPPEVYPREEYESTHAATQLVAEAPDRVELRFEAAWIPFLSGNDALAVALLGDHRDGESRSVTLFREYLTLLARSTRSIGHVPFGGRTEPAQDIELVGPSWTEQVSELRGRLVPPPMEDVRPLLTAWEEMDGDAAFHYLLGLIRYRSVPDGVPNIDQGTWRVPILACLDRALEKDPKLVWPRYLRASLALRAGEPEMARADLDVLADQLDLPEVAYLRALAYAAVDPELASREFARAAQLYPKRRRLRKETPGSSLFEDQPERKLYGAWALHELGRGDTGTATRVLQQWRGELDSPDDQLYLLLFQARVAAAEHDVDQAVGLIAKARQVNPNLKLPWLEEARLYRELDDEARVERAERGANAAIIPRPASLEDWLERASFGLQPFCRTQLFGTSLIRPPRK